MCLSHCSAFFNFFEGPFYLWFIKATQHCRKIFTYTKRTNFASLVSEAISCLKEIKNALGKLQKMRVFIDFWPLCKHYKFLRSEEFWNDLELKESWFMCNSCGFGHLSWQRFWGARERGEREVNMGNFSVVVTGYLLLRRRQFCSAVTRFNGLALQPPLHTVRYQFYTQYDLEKISLYSNLGPYGSPNLEWRKKPFKSAVEYGDDHFLPYNCSFIRSFPYARDDARHISLEEERNDKSRKSLSLGMNCHVVQLISLCMYSSYCNLKWDSSFRKKLICYQTNQIIMTDMIITNRF